MLTQDFADGETRIPTRRQHEGTYHFEDLPIESRRSLRVVCIGSGYSGLMMAIIVKEKFREANLEFQVYEKNHDMGGTWLVNRFMMA
jgi:ribulose 1,5-bisphosphate synthetase/thiazole synthase